MKIIQLNVRLAEGGAARIVLNLHKEALDRGNNSTFIYGYGKRGGDSAMAGQIPHNLRITGGPYAIANQVTHRLIGCDPFSDCRALGEFRHLVQLADIVHLHVIHSHMISYRSLFRLIEGKPTVWTHHDHWALTGRCAVPGSCVGYRSSCRPCQNKKAYPSSVFDFAGSEYRTKHATIENATHINHVAPSRHLADRISQAYGTDVKVIPNSIDSEFERALESRPTPEQREGGLLVVANDLSDAEKNDLGLIAQLARNPGIVLHFVGHNCPFRGQNIIDYGAILGRAAMLEIMDRSKALLFTSKIDNNPLIILEALCSGLPVIWLESPAAREILQSFDTVPIATSGQVAQEIISGFVHSGWHQWSHGDIAAQALSKFTAPRMAESYFSLYNKLAH